MAGRGASARVLITGANGFVGPYVAQALRYVCGPNVGIVPTSRDTGHDPMLGRIESLDVSDKDAVRDALVRHSPTHVIHLAGIAAPSAASADPEAAWRVHVLGARNLGAAILQVVPDCWLLHVGSGMVYGESARSGQLLSECDVIAPADEYAVTKAAADLALGVLTRRGLKCVRFRPFNHTGPGQADAFVVPAFAKQIATIEAGLAKPFIRVGNLEAERDFLDVRDVANAYALAVINSEKLVSGDILNVASGEPRRISEILKQLLARSTVEIAIEQDPDRIRPSDIPKIIGDASRLRMRLGWAPQHDFVGTLESVLDDWRARVRQH
jgi:GDP-4-dehydro-6-deoxy-D-mannose reductase